MYIPILIYQTPIVAVPELRDYYPPSIVNFHNQTWNIAWFDK